MTAELTLPDDMFTSGLQDFVEEARRRGLADRIHPWGRGDTFSL